MENKRSDTKHKVSEDLFFKTKSFNNIKQPQNNIDKSRYHIWLFHIFIKQLLSFFNVEIIQISPEINSLRGALLSFVYDALSFFISPLSFTLLLY